MISQKLNERSHVGFRFLITVFCFLFLFSFTSCGRRGDPVPITPYNEDAVTEDMDGDKDQVQAEKETVEQISETLKPDVPQGLMILYTQKVIILAWDEIKGQNVQLYKIYRSSGDRYELVGDTMAPAFTDHKIKPNMKYYYKVSAVGILESQPSKEIEIVTEGDQ